MLLLTTMSFMPRWVQWHQTGTSNISRRILLRRGWTQGPYTSHCCFFSNDLYYVSNLSLLLLWCSLSSRPEMMRVIFQYIALLRSERVGLLQWIHADNRKVLADAMNCIECHFLRRTMWTLEERLSRRNIDKLARGRICFYKTNCSYCISVLPRTRSPGRHHDETPVTGITYLLFESWARIPTTFKFSSFSDCPIMCGNLRYPQEHQKYWWTPGCIYSRRSLNVLGGTSIICTLF